MRYTPKEIKKLVSMGFEKSPAPLCYEYTNGMIILTVEKTDVNEFTLYNDMCEDDDLLKANNNFTEYGLTFNDLIEEIEGSY
jgi:hypothetical protein